MQKAVNVVFPHQLFEKSPLLQNGYPIYLIEEFLFFKQYPFHQQKIAFHRASMKFYEQYLQAQNIEVHYIESHQKEADIRQLISTLSQQKINEIHYIDTTDNWLEKRLQKSTDKVQIKLNQHPSPLFINTKEDLQKFFRKDKKKFFQTKFYIDQRKKLDILLEDGDKPKGGKWSFDAENRKKYPKNKIPPKVVFPQKDVFCEEAQNYVNQHFSHHIGTLTDTPLYPTNHQESQKWLQQFLENRFKEFGPYEDAIVANESILNHSVLTPMLNVGLMTPRQIIDETLNFATKNEIPLNSLEGFIRQVIGWREFIRGVYECKGVEQRTRNFWNFERKIPASFYNAKTGILPIDTTIQKLLKSGYCHHIERLMVLGNFMVLCEIDPDEVYRWFMEFFIDAYDWVMVPNVYGMSQFADGGLMSTKPYISGSNYLMKMSNYPKGTWQDTWNALFWRFMHVHRDFFIKNPRLSMLVRSFDKMSKEKQSHLLETADVYLNRLDKNLEHSQKATLF